MKVIVSSNYRAVTSKGVKVRGFGGGSSAAKA